MASEMSTFDNFSSPSFATKSLLFPTSLDTLYPARLDGLATCFVFAPFAPFRLGARPLMALPPASPARPRFRPGAASSKGRGIGRASTHARRLTRQHVHHGLSFIFTRPSVQARTVRSCLAPLLALSRRAGAHQRGASGQREPFQDRATDTISVVIRCDNIDFKSLFSKTSALVRTVSANQRERQRQRQRQRRRRRTTTNAEGQNFNVGEIQNLVRLKVASFRQFGIRPETHVG